MTVSSSQYSVRGVGPDGTAYATQNGSSQSQLYFSTDHARTWSLRGSHPRGASFRQLKALADGTLLADVQLSSNHWIARSRDRGATWTDVLGIGSFRMLQPNNIVELGGTVFFAEYQSFASLSDLRLWASTDRGSTWSVRHLFTGYRHAHGLVADPATGELWVLMGDYTGAILISNDLGRTWRTVYGPIAVVDGVVTPRGLLFGLDTLYKPDPAAVCVLKSDGTGKILAPLPGPSYSVLAPRAGGYLLETSREVSGDIYPPGDVSAHLFSSSTGDAWTEVFNFPRLSSTRDTHAFARFELATGEVVVQLENVQRLAPGGDGYLVIRRR